MNFNDYRKIAMAQAAADYGIDVSVFDGGSHVFAAKEFDSRAVKTKIGKPFLDMVYFGSGLAAAADERIIDNVRDYIARCGQNLFRAFDAPNIFDLCGSLACYGYGVGEMAHGFLPSETVKRSAGGEFGEFITLRGCEIGRLYEYKEFGEALCYSTDGIRRDVIAVACCDGSRPIAVAACSNDGAEMYQIGVDVLPKYRRHGLGAALVNKLTALIIESGKCPYYRCAWSNIASRRTAEACGYAEAWVELSFAPIRRS